MILKHPVSTCFTALAALGLSLSASAGSPINFGSGTEVMACHSVNDNYLVDNDDVQDTHPYLQITQNEAVDYGSRVVAFCVVRTSQGSVKLVDISSNGATIDSESFSLNRGNNCKTGPVIESAGFSADGRYAFLNAYWNGRPSEELAGRFAIAYRIEPKDGGTGGAGSNNRPVPSAPIYLGSTFKKKNCEQYMTSGLASVDDILVLASEDPGAGAKDPGSDVRYLAVGKNADGSLFNPSNPASCKSSDTNCIAPVEPNNGVGGFTLP